MLYGPVLVPNRNLPALSDLRTGATIRNEETGEGMPGRS